MFWHENNGIIHAPLKTRYNDTKKEALSPNQKMHIIILLGIESRLLRTESFPHNHLFT